MFFWNSCFFYDPMDVGNLTSASSAFFKSSLNIWKFMVHILLKSGLENFEHCFASVCDECNCVVVSDGKSVCLQCGRPGFDPWVGKIPWRRKRQPTPVLLPGKSHGRRSLVGCSPWVHKESATTEWLHFTSLCIYWKSSLILIETYWSYLNLVYT